MFRAGANSQSQVPSRVEGALDGFGFRIEEVLVLMGFKFSGLGFRGFEFRAGSWVMTMSNVTTVIIMFLLVFRNFMT